MAKWGAWGLVGVLALLLLTAVISGPLCGPGGGGDDGPDPGGLDAKGKLTPAVTKAINRQAAKFRVDPHILGAIALRETNGGKAIACSAIANTACGAMQLTKGWWGTNHCDGNRDGREDINNIDDNVCASITGLLKLPNPIKRRLMTRPEVMGMAKNYCGACLDINCGRDNDGGYCVGVARNVKRLGGTFGTGKTPTALSGGDDPAAATSTASAQTCPVSDEDDATAPTGSGKWKIAPGAFSSAVPIDPLLSRYLDQVAKHTSRPPILTTGSAGHGKYTTNGSLSEHGFGRAGDFGNAANKFPLVNVGPGSPHNYGDELAAAALITAGISPGVAAKNERRGGITNVETDFGSIRIRVQVIYRSNNRDLGGNHLNHVHIGVKKLGRATRGKPTLQHLGP